MAKGEKVYVLATRDLGYDSTVIGVSREPRKIADLAMEIVGNFADELDSVEETGAALKRAKAVLGRWLDGDKAPLHYTWQLFLGDDVVPGLDLVIEYQTEL